jgi:4-amino-4-deoxy-L-arabinose transferase-like glycosyltransferase
MDRQNFYLNILKSVIISIFVIFIGVQASKKFVLDEIDFPAVAHATSESGVPIYYRSEQNQAHLGTYHPPLYIYSLAAFVKVFGFSEFTVRIFGALCTLITAYLTILIGLKLLPQRESSNVFTVIFLSIFLTHPYTFANATLPDIDQTVLPITISLYIYLLLRNLPSLSQFSLNLSANEKSVPSVILLSFIFSLNLWAKLTTPLALLPLSFLILFICGSSFKRCFLVVTSVAAVGVLIFIITYYIYCYFFNLPFEYTFKFLIDSFLKGTASNGPQTSTIYKILSNLSYLKYFSNWISISFIFIFFVSFFYLLLKSNKTKSEYILTALTLFGLFVTIFYISLISPFGGFFKYPFTVFTFLILPISYFLTLLIFPLQYNKINNDRHIGKWLTPASQNLLPFIIFITFFVSSFLYQAIINKDTSIRLNQPTPFYLLFSVFFLAIIFSFLCKYNSTRFYLKCSIIIFLASLLGSQLGISRFQALAKYPTKYDYGKTGMDETISYLKSRVNPSEVIWSMKDIGYYVNNRYFENYMDIFDSSLESKLTDMITNKNIRYFVVTTGIGQDRLDAYPSLKRSLDACCVVEREFGNFVIYRANK